MVKYNWEKVLSIVDFNEIKVLQFFCIATLKYMPRYLEKNLSINLYKRAKDRGLPKGNSYIINIEPLLVNNSNYSTQEIFNYIELASMRSLFEYNLKGIRTLPVMFGKGKEKLNRLITVHNEQIYFKYEME
jgi:hypothetical protein